MSNRRNVLDMPEELANEMPKEMPMAGGAASHRAVPVILAGVVGLLFAGTIALWIHYGTVVFFEMIRAGFMACFG